MASFGENPFAEDDESTTSKAICETVLPSEDVFEEYRELNRVEEHRAFEALQEKLHNEVKTAEEEVTKTVERCTALVQEHRSQWEEAKHQTAGTPQSSESDASQPLIVAYCAASLEAFPSSSLPAEPSMRKASEDAVRKRRRSASAGSTPHVLADLAAAELEELSRAMQTRFSSMLLPEGEGAATAAGAEVEQSTLRVLADCITKLSTQCLDGIKHLRTAERRRHQLSCVKRWCRSRHEGDEEEGDRAGHYALQQEQQYSEALTTAITEAEGIVAAAAQAVPANRLETTAALHAAHVVDMAHLQTRKAELERETIRLGQQVLSYRQGREEGTLPSGGSVSEGLQQLQDWQRHLLERMMKWAEQSSALTTSGAATRSAEEVEQEARAEWLEAYLPVQDEYLKAVAAIHGQLVSTTLFYLTQMLMTMLHGGRVTSAWVEQLIGEEAPEQAADMQRLTECISSLDHLEVEADERLSQACVGLSEEIRVATNTEQLRWEAAIQFMANEGIFPTGDGEEAAQPTSTPSCGHGDDEADEGPITSEAERAAMVEEVSFILKRAEAALQLRNAELVKRREWFNYQPFASPLLDLMKVMQSNTELEQECEELKAQLDGEGERATDDDDEMVSLQNQLRELQQEVEEEELAVLL